MNHFDVCEKWNLNFGLSIIKRFKFQPHIINRSWNSLTRNPQFSFRYLGYSKKQYSVVTVFLMKYITKLWSFDILCRMISIIVYWIVVKVVVISQNIHRNVSQPFGSKYKCSSQIAYFSERFKPFYSSYNFKSISSHLLFIVKEPYVVVIFYQFFFTKR